MNRTIKFRAWDKKRKVMIGTDYPDNWGEDMNERWNDDAKMNLTGIEEIDEDTHFVVMQYTGLKDKHGKEIYEGDIVKCSAGCPHAVEWQQEIGGKYGGGMPGFYLVGLLTGYGEGYAWIGTEEVIGNIYENPELLEE